MAWQLWGATVGKGFFNEDRYDRIVDEIDYINAVIGDVDNDKRMELESKLRDLERELNYL